MTKNKNSTKRTGGICDIRGHGVLTPSMGNSAGVPVVDRWEIDTNLLTTWSSLGLAFEKWRVKKIKATYVPALCLTDGNYALAFLEDVEDTSPTDIISCGSLRVSTITTLNITKSIHWYPKTVTAEGWLFTKDLISQNDRIEMVGDLIGISQNMPVTARPGYILLEYHLQFCQQTTTGVSLEQLSKIVLKKSLFTSKEEKSKESEIKELEEKLNKLKQSNV